MAGRLTPEDRAEISDVLARYCWFVDEGDSEAWADLWLEDGVFAGVTREPIRGRQALLNVPVWSQAGGCRHKLVNLVMEYGRTPDEAVVRGYNFITAWVGEPRIHSLALARYEMVRRGDTWKIRSNQVRMMVPPGYDPANYPEGFPYPADQPTRFPPVD